MTEQQITSEKQLDLEVASTSSSLCSVGSTHNSDAIRNAPNDDQPPSPPTDNGAIFGYLSLLPLLAGVVQFTIHFIAFIQTHGFTLFSAELIVQEKEARDETGAAKIIIWIHAFLAIGILSFMAYQYTSGLFLTLSKHKQETLLRRLHRYNGRFTAVMWFLTIVSGYVATYRPNYREHAPNQPTLRFTIVLTHASGIVMLLNLWVGIRAVTGPKESRDYILHKGCMYFTYVWVAFTSATGALVVNILTFAGHQLDCPAQDKLQFITLALVFALQVALSWWAGLQWGGDSFRRPFVKYNFRGLAFTALVICAGATVNALSSLDETHPGCLVDGYL